MGAEVIEAIDRTHGFNLLVKPHDHPKNQIDWFGALAPLESERVRLVRDFDVIPYLEAADLLITDASSVAIEYTLLDRPMIFLDVPNLIRQIEKRSAAADLSTYGRKIGTVVSGPGTLVDAIRDALAHPDRESDLRRAAAAHVFHRPGGAADRVASVVRHAAGIETVLPADIEVVMPCEAAE
jgi:CDP-glycerol glycerophosphotransferase (TagB/SpsB family)